jgi:hypothetical protein
MENELKRIITEELTRADVNGMISGNQSDIINSKEFKDKVKEISAKVIEELYKIMWTRKNFWSDAIKK